MPLTTWIHIIYLWSIEASNKQGNQLTGIRKGTITNAYACIREICDRYLQKYPIQFGGPGVIVQIDESLFSHKAKYRHGRLPKEQIWVFGIVQTSYRPAMGFMEIVEDRSAETLLPIILNVVDKKLVIHSDEWKSYNEIQRSGYEHKTVNHSLRFVEPETRVA